MSGEQPYMQGQGTDEKLVVEEMIRNSNSKHWEQCLEFVKPRVYAKTKNVPREDQEEIVQEVMCKVVKYLPSFRFECTFRTWLFPIIDHCIKDKYRADAHHGFLYEERLYQIFAELLDEGDSTGEEFRAKEELSAEEVFEIYEKIRNGLKALQEYVRTRSNRERNGLIIQTVILEEHTYGEAARRADCDEGVVGYIVREAKRYAREKLRD